MSNVAINISAEYTGKKAFSQAEKNVRSLEKNVKKLASGLGVAFGVTAVTAFGRAAVKAFAADEAAAVRLANAVDNLGISFANPAIAKFVSELEKSAGVADDVLRPAFQGLLTTTGSLTASQKLLNDAITISRGTGVDLATVAQDLANGYVGITKGLKKYNTGLTQSELKTKSFSDVLGVLLKQSSGAAAAYMETTAFKFDVLGVATDNLKEKIGQGLVDAMARVGGGTETSDAVKAMELFATAVYKTELGIGNIIGAIPTLLRNVKNLPKNIFQGFVGAQGGISMEPYQQPKKPVPTKTQQQKLLEKLEKDAAKRAKDLAAAQAKITAEQKKQAALKKAGTLFDVEQANLLAALQGKLSEDDKLRAKAQLALLNGNEVVATELTKKILMAQDATGNLYEYWKNIPDAKNPFGYLDDWIKEFQKKLNALQIPSPSAPQAAAAISNSDVARLMAPVYQGTGTAQGGSVIDNYLAGLGIAGAAAMSNVAPVASTSTLAGSSKYAGSGQGSSIMDNYLNVVVQLDGKTIAQSNQAQSLSGTPSGISRVSGMFGG